MGIRTEGTAALERRVKRRLAKYKIDLLKPVRPDPKVLAHGGYKLREALTSRIILGETPYPFSKTLEEVEAYIDELDAAGED